MSKRIMESELCLDDKVMDDLDGKISTVVGLTQKVGVVDGSKAHYLNAETVVIIADDDSTKELKYRFSWEVTKIPVINEEGS